MDCSFLALLQFLCCFFASLFLCCFVKGLVTQWPREYHITSCLLGLECLVFFV
jgi:hypothetical protein